MQLPPGRQAADAAVALPDVLTERHGEGQVQLRLPGREALSARSGEVQGPGVNVTRDA